jgi:ferredoxin
MAVAHCRATFSLVPDERAAPRASVLYRSRGVVLVAGDDASGLAAARDLARTLKVVMFAPGAQAGDLQANPLVVSGRIASLEGRLGDFRATARANEGEVDIGGFSPNGDRRFDLVLDLQAAPLLQRSVPPPGYFAPADGELAGALEAIRALVGTFSKPIFFDYVEELCAHGAQGYKGCTRCLSVCGAGAIRSDGDRIAADPHLCQGCAACTLACPTGALSIRDPSRGDLLARLESAIAGTRRANEPPVVVVYARAQAAFVEPLLAGGNGVALEVEPLAAFGEETWFGALAQGARGVVIVAEADSPIETRSLFAERVALARTVLAAAGLPADAVRMVEPDGLARALADAPPGREARSAGALDASRKRGVLADALSRIESTSGFAPAALAKGAPLGSIAVDRTTCTLCWACANLCPTGAIHHDEQPAARLSLSEEACVQCGVCEAACPEHAIALVPRIAPAGERREPRLLHEDDPARCPQCGAAFLSARLLKSSIAKVASRMPLTPEAVQRMHLCPACRQRGILLDVPG